MAITSDLDNIVKWFEEEVCPGILLKVPDGRKELYERSFEIIN